MFEGKKLDSQPAGQKNSPATPEIIRGNLPEKTNSPHFDRKGVASPIKSSDRNHQDNKKYVAYQWKDSFIIGLFSLEASATHAKKFHGKLKDKTTLFNHTVKGNISEEIKEEFSKNVAYTDEKSIENALIALFKAKWPPHVIPVIEGNRNSFNENVTIPNNDGEKHVYKLHSFYIQGKNALDYSDDKQSMHFYVREDMKDVMLIQETVIQIDPTKNFKVAEIIFETESDKKYSVLIPHIPNDFVKNQKDCDNVHTAFKTYAENELKKNIIVTGYIGDTNYKKAIKAHSEPSFGGNVEGNDDNHYIVPTSSSAAKHTYFMQAIALNETINSFAMQQPSTLNLVNINNTTENTDHPSIQTKILLDSTIKGRKYNTVVDINDTKIPAPEPAVSLKM